jgi:putative ABC transport system permease protein
VLTESVLLALVGGALGVGMARVALPAALALLPPENGVPRMDEIALDRVVLVFTLGVSVLAGILFGLAPAARASQTRVHDSLKDIGRGSTTNRRMKRVGDALAIAEISLSLLLLAGAGLMIRSFLRLQAVDSGFETTHVLAMQLTVPAHRYGQYEVGGPNPRRAALYRELAERTREIPGVQAAAVTGLLPLRHGVNPWGISIEGRGAPSEKERGGASSRLREGLFHHGSISIERVTADYFRTMGIRLIRGRTIDERDTAGAPLVTVVNETFVRKFFPGEDPIGRRLTADMTSYFPTLTIVGIVADNKMHGLDQQPYPLLYWPLLQFPSTNAWLVVRSNGGPEALARAVPATVAMVDRDIAIANITTMEEVLANSVWRPRFATLLLGIFALVALLLATAGVYAVISYSVAQRTREVGLRVSLGAAPREILRLIVGHGALLGGLGVSIGVLGALALRSILATQLFGVSPSDPLTLLVVSALLMAIALTASAVPAVRAMRLDPVAALRGESR